MDNTNGLEKQTFSSDEYIENWVDYLFIYPILAILFFGGFLFGLASLVGAVGYLLLRDPDALLILKFSASVIGIGLVIYALIELYKMKSLSKLVISEKGIQIKPAKKRKMKYSWDEIEIYGYVYSGFEIFTKGSSFMSNEPLYVLDPQMFLGKDQKQLDLSMSLLRFYLNHNYPKAFSKMNSKYLQNMLHKSFIDHELYLYAVEDLPSSTSTGPYNYAGLKHLFETYQTQDPRAIRKIVAGKFTNSADYLEAQTMGVETAAQLELLRKYQVEDYQIVLQIEKGNFETYDDLLEATRCGVETAEHLALLRKFNVEDYQLALSIKNGRFKDLADYLEAQSVGVDNNDDLTFIKRFSAKSMEEALSLQRLDDIAKLNELQKEDYIWSFSRLAELLDRVEISLPLLLGQYLDEGVITGNIDLDNKRFISDIPTTHELQGILDAIDNASENLAISLQTLSEITTIDEKRCAMLFTRISEADPSIGQYHANERVFVKSIGIEQDIDELLNKFEEIEKKRSGKKI